MPIADQALSSHTLFISRGEFEVNERLVSTIALFLILASLQSWNDVYASWPIPPTLEEVVAGSEHIGLVTINKSEDYRRADEYGDIQCGVIYEGSWIDSLTGDKGRIKFASKQVLEVRGVYLVYLANKPLPRRLASTSSWAESAREKRVGREKKCRRSRRLPQTIFHASKFTDEEAVADVFRTGIWVQMPYFSNNTLKEIVIMPTELKIGEDVISRERLIEEFFDEYKHQVIRTAGWDQFIFKAVEWEEYCMALVNAVRSAQNLGSVVHQRNEDFCSTAPQR